MGILQLFTGRQREVLESINGITLTGQDIIKFGDVVHDFSEQHRNKEVAKKHCFEDTPVIGVHSAAIGGRLSRDLMSAIQIPGAPYFHTGLSVTFREPIYPSEPINWNPPVIDFEEEIGRIAYHLLIPNQIADKKPRVEMTSEFRTKRPEFQAPNPEKFVYSEETEFVPKEVKVFYECLREEPKEL